MKKLISLLLCLMLIAACTASATVDINFSAAGMGNQLVTFTAKAGYDEDNAAGFDLSGKFLGTVIEGLVRLSDSGVTAGLGGQNYHMSFDEAGKFAAGIASALAASDDPVLSGIAGIAYCIYNSDSLISEISPILLNELTRAAKIAVEQGLVARGSWGFFSVNTDQNSIAEFVCTYLDELLNDTEALERLTTSSLWKLADLPNKSALIVYTDLIKREINRWAASCQFTLYLANSRRDNLTCSLYYIDRNGTVSLNLDVVNDQCALTLEANSSSLGHINLDLTLTHSMLKIRSKTTVYMAKRTQTYTFDLMLRRADDGSYAMQLTYNNAKDTSILLNLSLTDGELHAYVKGYTKNIFLGNKNTSFTINGVVRRDGSFDVSGVIGRGSFSASNRVVEYNNIFSAAYSYRNGVQLDVSYAESNHRSIADIVLTYREYEDEAPHTLTVNADLRERVISFNVDSEIDISGRIDLNTLALNVYSYDMLILKGEASAAGSGFAYTVTLNTDGTEQVFVLMLDAIDSGLAVKLLSGGYEIAEGQLVYENENSSIKSNISVSYMGAKLVDVDLTALYGGNALLMRLDMQYLDTKLRLNANIIGLEYDNLDVSASLDMAKGNGLGVNLGKFSLKTQRADDQELRAPVAVNVTAEQMMALLTDIFRW